LKEVGFTISTNTTKYIVYLVIGLLHQGPHILEEWYKEKLFKARFQSVMNLKCSDKLPVSFSVPLPPFIINNLFGSEKCEITTLEQLVSILERK
jgi:hypothetical protein